MANPVVATATKVIVPPPTPVPDYMDATWLFGDDATCMDCGMSMASMSIAPGDRLLLDPAEVPDAAIYGEGEGTLDSPLTMVGGSVGALVDEESLCECERLEKEREEAAAALIQARWREARRQREAAAAACIGRRGLRWLLRRRSRRKMAVYQRSILLVQAKGRRFLAALQVETLRRHRLRQLRLLVDDVFAARRSGTLHDATSGAVSEEPEDQVEFWNSTLPKRNPPPPGVMLAPGKLHVGVSPKYRPPLEVAFAGH